MINWHFDKNFQPHEAQSLKLDSSKFMNMNDWTPKWDLKKTIFRTINWYKEFHKGRDLAELCQKDLLEYLK